MKAPEKTPPADASGLQIGKLRSSLESLGLLVDYLSKIEPFSRYDFGNFTSALRQQLSRGEHLVAFSNKRLVGYCGWLPTSTEVAKAWTTDGGPLLPKSGDEADAVVLTVIATTESVAMSALLRRARVENPKRRVYFKREYGDEDRVARKSSVENVTGK